MREGWETDYLQGCISYLAALPNDSLSLCLAGGIECSAR